MKKKITQKTQMQDFGEAIGRLLRAGDLIFLTGDLGAGKTTLTKGIAKALGIRRPVKSPTFTIVREYQESQPKLFHMDMYRLEDGDISSIDMAQYLDGEGIVIIEWPEYVADKLPKPDLQIAISRDDEDLEATTRQVEVTAETSRGKQLLAALAI